MHEQLHDAVDKTSVPEIRETDYLRLIANRLSE